MDAPINTINYLIGGYAVIFGVMLIYLASLIARWHKLRQEAELLKDYDQLEE